jgi:hypothetical protein
MMVKGAVFSSTQCHSDPQTVQEVARRGSTSGRLPAVGLSPPAFANGIMVVPAASLIFLPPPETFVSAARLF